MKMGEAHFGPKHLESTLLSSTNIINIIYCFQISAHAFSPNKEKLALFIPSLKPTSFELANWDEL